MHALSHTLAHRAPPASRTRARWQPYNSLPTYTALSSTPSSSSSSSRSSSSPVSDSTPATSVISPCQPTPTCDTSAIRSVLQNTTSAPSAEPLRDAASSKNKFALGLVDQAVKTLCEVWRPQDIPPAFSNPRTTRPSPSLPNFTTKANAFEANPLHRSHSNANITSSSTSIPTTHTIPPSTATPALIQPGTSTELRNLVPIRGFVHEVLRRSRTSGCVLQTALCYLEAIRPKISELVQLERIGKGTDGEPESGPRIFQATEEEIERSRLEEAMELSMEYSMAMTCDSAATTVRIPTDSHDVDAMDTVRIDEVEQEDSAYGLISPDESSMTQPRGASSLPMAVDAPSNIEETDLSITNSSGSTPSASVSSSTSSISTTSSDSLSSAMFTKSQQVQPQPHLPSPLLCPRRAFLAALILASKFTQDKCYSNRAWAKLSGLPPREIGRCERALGSALEWRLWVGKASVPVTPSPSSSPSAANVVPTQNAAHRAVARCQSESALNMTVSSSVPEHIVSQVTPPLPVNAICESSAARLETAIAAAAVGGVRASDVRRAAGPHRTVKRASTMPSGTLASALGSRFARSQHHQSMCEIASPSGYPEPSGHNETYYYGASSTLVPSSSSSVLPAVHLQVASPTPSASSSTSTSGLSGSPSPDMPGLSYSPSPSSVSSSSSPASIYSGGANTDRVMHMSGSFEDSGSMSSSEFMDSPVARINTRLLVPGYTGASGNVGGPGQFYHQHQQYLAAKQQAIPQQNPFVPTFLSPTPMGVYGGVDGMGMGVSPPVHVLGDVGGQESFLFQFGSK